MSAEAKAVALLLLMIVIAAGLVGWADYSAIAGLLGRIGQSLAATTSSS